MSGRLMYPSDPDGPVDNPTICREKSMTRQSEAEECDINRIMARYEKTGVLPLETREAVFMDVSELGTYQDVLANIQKAEAGFLQLPPKVRERFGNDVASFLDFCQVANPAELEELGLVEKAPEGAVATPEAASEAKGS